MASLSLPPSKGPRSWQRGGKSCQAGNRKKQGNGDGRQRKGLETLVLQGLAGARLCSSAKDSAEAIVIPPVEGCEAPDKCRDKKAFDGLVPLLSSQDVRADKIKVRDWCRCGVLHRVLVRIDAALPRAVSSVQELVLLRSQRRCDGPGGLLLLLEKRGRQIAGVAQRKVSRGAAPRGEGVEGVPDSHQGKGVAPWHHIRSGDLRERVHEDGQKPHPLYGSEKAEVSLIPRAVRELLRQEFSN
mmetsp:Transcript_5386/g.16286  ORF Transcript_5386/g.16286 Transcript_5386/m.16286 type:complete len:242 (-) Transcript_5386:1284-2009(-)